MNNTGQLTSQQSPTANAILNILQQISISPPESPVDMPNHTSSSSNNNSVYGGGDASSPLNLNSNSLPKLSISALQHLHSLQKSIIPKRRLSSSSSFDGYTVNSSNDKNRKNKRQLAFLRGHKLQNARPMPSPLSRSHFIKRLNTFSVLNWTISNNKLSPLICAAQGFKCHPTRKNVLHCTSCHAVIIVKLPDNPELEFQKTNKFSNKKIFNNLHHTDNYNNILNNNEKYELPFQFQLLDDDEDEFGGDEYGFAMDSADDDIHIYETLVNSYVSRLATDHYPNCTFLPLLPLSPKDENYYITPKDIAREVYKFENRLAIMKRNKDLLIGKNFKSSFLSKDERLFLLEYLRQVSKDDIEIDCDDDDNNVDVDNVHHRNLYENPSLDVILPALLGWELKIQQFKNEKFLLLNCECCTRRILLSTMKSNEDSTNREIEELSACPYKAEIPAEEEMTEFDETVKVHHWGSNLYGHDEEDEEEEEDDDVIDLEQEHDNWCCMKQGWRVVLEGLRSCSDISLHTGGSTATTAELYNTSMEHLSHL